MQLKHLSHDEINVERLLYLEPLYTILNHQLLYLILLDCFQSIQRYDYFKH